MPCLSIVISVLLRKAWYECSGVFRKISDQWKNIPFMHLSSRYNIWSYKTVDKTHHSLWGGIPPPWIRTCTYPLGLVPSRLLLGIIFFAKWLLPTSQCCLENVCTFAKKARNLIIKKFRSFPAIHGKEFRNNPWLVLKLFWQMSNLLLTFLFPKINLTHAKSQFCLTCKWFICTNPFKIFLNTYAYWYTIITRCITVFFLICEVISFSKHDIRLTVIILQHENVLKIQNIR